MKNTILISTLAVILLLSPALQAGHKGKGHQQKLYYDHAKVINVEPIIRFVSVSVPQQECWQEQVSYPPRVYRTDAAGNMILGGILGGVVGSRFGGGDGKKIATLAGTLIGASIGHDKAARRPQPINYGSTGYEQRCHVSHQRHEEERIDGYRVTYRYKGEIFTTRLPYDPGDRLKVQVSVTPVRGMKF